jgi:hypothetical protein
LPSLRKISAAVQTVDSSRSVFKTEFVVQCDMVNGTWAQRQAAVIVDCGVGEPHVVVRPLPLRFGGAIDNAPPLVFLPGERMSVHGFDMVVAASEPKWSVGGGCTFVTLTAAVGARHSACPAPFQTRCPLNHVVEFANVHPVDVSGTFTDKVQMVVARLPSRARVERVDVEATGPQGMALVTLHGQVCQQTGAPMGFHGSSMVFARSDSVSVLCQVIPCIRSFSFSDSRVRPPAHRPSDVLRPIPGRVPMYITVTTRTGNKVAASGIYHLEELFAGMINGDTMGGTMFNEAREEIGLEVRLASTQWMGAAIPSGGATLEWLQEMVMRLYATEDEIERLRGRETGEATEGEVRALLYWCGGLCSDSRILLSRRSRCVSAPQRRSTRAPRTPPSTPSLRRPWPTTRSAASTAASTRPASTPRSTPTAPFSATARPTARRRQPN